MKTQELELHGNSYYIIVLRYMGQQGVGVKSLTYLQCWASHTGLPMVIVEPAISKSVMTGDIWTSKVIFGDLFDLNHFNDVSKNAGYPEIARIKQFYHQGPMNIVYVSIKHHHSTVDFTNSESCFTTQIPHSMLDSFRRKGYCIVNVVSVNSERLTSQLLQDILGKWINTNITIIFERYGPWFTNENEVACKGISDTFSHQFRSSIRILNDTKNYEETYLDSSHPVAVLMRTEHVIRKKKSNLVECLSNVISVAKKIQGDNIDNIPMVAVDFGMYGSNSWLSIVTDNITRIKAQNQVKVAIQTLLRNKMTFEVWEKGFSSVASQSGEINEGYIAALQRTIASRAKCLILMGGGVFQELVLKDYLDFHPDLDTWCIHFICTDNKKQLKNLIQFTEKKLNLTV